MKINEVDPRNYDSDIDYYDAVNRAGRKAYRDPDSYEKPEPYDAEDDIAQQRQAAAAKFRQKRETQWETKQEGTAPNGQKYNSRYIINAVDKSTADMEEHSFTDYHWGAKKLVDKEYGKDGDRVVLTLYMVDNHKYGLWRPWKDSPVYKEGVAEGLNEMDKSAPQPGRDGKVSHSTYGSRDKKGSDYFKGKEALGKPITKKQIEKDALDILKKQGVAEGESPESEIERLKLRQNAEHGSASLKRQAETQARIRELEKQIKDKKGVAEGFKNTYSVGDRIDSPLGTGVIVAVSPHVSTDGRVKVKLDDPSRAGEDGKYKDTFVLDTTQLKHIADEKANPYAIGMAQAMKSTGDKPPLKKSTINKAHEIARAIKKDEK